MPNLNPRVVGDLPYPNRSSTTNMELAVGGIKTIPVNAAGSGYSIGDKLVIPAPLGAGVQAVAEVETVSGTGGILTVKVTNPGAGYTGVVTATIPSATTPATFNNATLQNSVAVFKGRIYSVDTDGRLRIPDTSGNIADLITGAVQARATTVIGDGFTKVQVITGPSRILLKASVANLKVNDKVDMFTSDATTPVQDTVKLNGAFSNGYIGRIFEIETKNADGSKKLLTAIGDLVVVDLGVAQ